MKENGTERRKPDITAPEDIERLVHDEEVKKAMKASLRTEDDILLQPVGDRRKLPHVPDPENRRTHVDRRGGHRSAEETDGYKDRQTRDEVGRRYVVDYPLSLVAHTGEHRTVVSGRVCNISGSGMLCEVPAEYRDCVETADSLHVSFTITPGSLPEGAEMKVKSLGATWVRTVEVSYDENQREAKIRFGLQFDELLTEYARRRQRRYMITTSVLMMVFLAFFVVLLRAESILYFSFDRTIYFYSILAAAFLLSRYLFGALYRPVPVNPKYTPGVTVIIPCFNEETWIKRTVLSCVNQEYPPDKLEVIVIDDRSNDESWHEIKTIVDELRREDRYTGETRIRCHRQPSNMGKREALAVGAQLARHELLVFVDSDSFLDPFAIRNLVQPFQDKHMGGVAGRTDVANTYTNHLTKMQAVRYYIAFRILKAAEGVFDAVTCLSGPLSCYRKDLVLKYSERWLHQTFLGQKATFGDDRAMTNLILRHHRTTYQDTAVCSTIVPNTYKVFLKQQMRWKRSWLRESMIAATFMWRKEPFMAASFYMGLLVPLLAPIIVVYNLFYIPLTHHIFPITFLLGMLAMALLMSFAQLLLRRSSIWLYGLWFCLYYEAVLLWQMPVAWVTFWKSTWGTRMTTADVTGLVKSMRKKRDKEGADE